MDKEKHRKPVVRSRNLAGNAFFFSLCPLPTNSSRGEKVDCEILSAPSSSSSSNNIAFINIIIRTRRAGVLSSSILCPFVIHVNRHPHLWLCREKGGGGVGWMRTCVVGGKGHKFCLGSTQPTLCYWVTTKWNNKSGSKFDNLEANWRDYRELTGIRGIDREQRWKHSTFLN